MGIEPRGAEHAYCCVIAVSRREVKEREVLITTKVTHYFDACDSLEEAYGRGMQVAVKLFPKVELWNNHDIRVIQLDAISWIGRLDIKNVKFED